MLITAYTSFSALAHKATFDPFSQSSSRRPDSPANNVQRFQKGEDSKRV